MHRHIKKTGTSLNLNNSVTFFDVFFPPRVVTLLRYRYFAVKFIKEEYLKDERAFRAHTHTHMNMEQYSAQKNYPYFVLKHTHTDPSIK